MTTVRNKSIVPATLTPTVRCALYTRKSTEEGLQQDFNTLDAQRESAEAYVTAHKHEGWVALPDRYDDGGYTGGNLDRPAFKRLMADVEANKVDAIVVYKIDRLSRSLLDFGRVMEVLERHNVALVAITQSLDTKTSMGRLTLNVLLSFAQFEREIISERTRDKIAAARRKGKWSGGKPVLGYETIALPGGTRLVVNEDEAIQVRAMFDLYLRLKALTPVAAELNRRGWTTKRWRTKEGRLVGGRPWGKTDVYKLLTNVTYVGRVRHHAETFAGEHAAIVEPAVWQRVQTTLTRNGGSGGAGVRNKYGALLRGLLRCVGCDCAMMHAYSQKAATDGAVRRYRYYVCLRANQRGWTTCHAPSVPAGEIERFVVDQIRAIGSEPSLLDATIRQVRQQQAAAIAELEAEQRRLKRLLGRQNKTIDPQAQRRLTGVEDRLIRQRSQQIEEGEVREALARFDPVWEALDPREQVRLMALLVERVDYDGKAGTVAVTFLPNGIKALVEQNQMQGVHA